MMRMVATLLGLGLVGPVLAAEPPPKFTPEQLSLYEDKVKPILQMHCLKCHGAGEKIKGGLNLTSRTSIIEGGDSGAAVDLKKPADSLLLQAIEHSKEGYAMPPKAPKLAVEQRKTLAAWVTAGLPFPASALAPPVEVKPSVVTDEARKYWAYQPAKKIDVPGVKTTSEGIDALLAESRKASGLVANSRADKVTLVRRAYYDLWGLPPTPAQVDEFVNDGSSTAYAKLIDKLLASEHYGEKWGRHWLDLVRYGETNGYERDGPKPNAWRYRDYVIRSFNADKPYDRFVKEQLAGDELYPGDRDAIIATGYFRLGVWDDEPADELQSLFDGYDDWVATTSQVFLGMTLNCARCHDHKKDPIPQTDYYKLLAFLRDVRPYSDNRNPNSKNNQTDITPPEKRTEQNAFANERKKKADELRIEMKPLEDKAIKLMSPVDQLKVDDGKRNEVLGKVAALLEKPERAQYNRLKKELEELENKPLPYTEFALSANNCHPVPPKTTVMVRGNPHVPGKEVQPGFPEVLGIPDPVTPAAKPGAKTSGRRTVLVNWLVGPSNTLSARVFVNRVWQHHFGRGIVPSPNDFGKLGENPTHPKLLDYLTTNFMAQGWSLKAMHRNIMLSQAYQMASSPNDKALAVDPANNTYWRFPMRRLAAEEVRDSILAVTGSLKPTMFGPSIYPKIPKEVLAGQSVPGQGWHTTQGPDANRRSVYVFVKRSLLVPVLTNHDAADTDSSCPVRYTTTVPTQALNMLNGEYANEQAMVFAKRLQAERPSDSAKQIALAIRLTTGRVPAEEEIKRDSAFMKKLVTEHKLTEQEALVRYCLMLLNTNEFVYLD